MRAADLGAAYGTAKSGVGVSSMGVMKPDLIMKSIIPVVMAGVLGIYGLIIAVIIANGGARAASPAPADCAATAVGRPPNPLLRPTAVMPPTSEGTTKYSSFTGFAHLAAGLACGLRCVPPPPPPSLPPPPPFPSPPPPPQTRPRASGRTLSRRRAAVDEVTIQPHDRVSLGAYGPKEARGVLRHARRPARHGAWVGVGVAV